jgi:hypothetical protein
MDCKSIPLSADYRFIDRTGSRFGRWLVVGYAGKRKNDHTWLCKCDCGTERTCLAGMLASGKSKSCGCQKAAAISRSRSKPNRDTAEYTAWTRMKDRCSNPNGARFKNYGGRGIKVCARWLDSFENFFADMGPRPSPKHSLDRRDVNGDYEKDNCRWATVREQSRNKAKTIYVERAGSTVPLVQAIEDAGLLLSSAVYMSFYSKMKRGLTFERVLAGLQLN